MASWYPYEDFKRCWANVREGYGNSKNTGDMGFLSGWQGRNVCRLKGVCCFWQPTPGKHRPAKPFGKSGLNTFGKGGRKNGAGFLKVAGFGGNERDFVNTW